VTAPSISICVLNWNYARFLGKAIESALHQTPGNYVPAGVVVVDDGSTDDSLRVCERYGSRITVVPCAHRGFAATLSEAILRGTGDWIALLDADDWFAAGKLATVCGELSGDRLLVQHWEYVVDVDGVPLRDDPHPGGSTSTLVVRRDAARDLLPVTNELFFHAFDRLGRGATVRQPLTYYRVHDSSMTDRRSPGVRAEYQEQVHRQVAERLADLAKRPPAWACRSALRRAAWWFATDANAYAREAAFQRQRRGAAWRALGAELGCFALARRSWVYRAEGIRSTVTMRPLSPLHRGRAADAVD
jgi:glycosyltransferase involved in cell wall biosynthesis